MRVQEFYDATTFTLTYVVYDEVTRDAVDRLPAPVLAVIDDCQGRIVAGVILDQSLSESGRRTPEPVAT